MYDRYMFVNRNSLLRADGDKNRIELFIEHINKC